MPKKTRPFLTAITTIILTGIPNAKPAQAIGLGLYTTYQLIEETAKIDIINIYKDEHISYTSSYTAEIDNTNKSLGIGIVLDTAVARNSAFNYRLNIGAHNFQYKFGDEHANSYTGQGGHIENIFGLGIGRNHKIRLWIGPTIGAKYEKGNNTTYNTIKLTTWSIYGGIALGCNIHTSESSSLFLNAHYAKHYGRGKIYDSDEKFPYETEAKGYRIYGGMMLRIFDVYMP